MGQLAWNDLPGIGVAWNKYHLLAPFLLRAFIAHMRLSKVPMSVLLHNMRLLLVHVEV